MSTHVPTVTPEMVSHNPDFPGSVIFTINCPFCGQRHTHGHGSPEDQTWGTRLSHCAEGGEYNIVP